MRSIYPFFLALFVILLVSRSRRAATVLSRRGAISPDTAQPLDEMNARDRAYLDRLIAAGVVREAAPGRYYHDVATERAKMRARMPWLVGLIVILAIVAVALGWTVAHRVRPLS